MGLLVTILPPHREPCGEGEGFRQDQLQSVGALKTLLQGGQWWLAHTRGRELLRSEGLLRDMTMPVGWVAMWVSLIAMVKLGLFS